MKRHARSLKGHSMNRNTIILSFLYLVPWGIQCLVTNFMPVYLAELPFTNEEIIGYIMAFASVVTIVSQMVWARIADKSKNKNLVLMWSLIGVTAFALMFTLRNMSLLTVCILVFLFYSCYMVHQTLIDTIAVEQGKNLKMPFSTVRSFASLGYALAGMIFGLAGQQSAGAIFYFVAFLGLLSVFFAIAMPKADVSIKKEKESKDFKAGKSFVLLLVYTFMLYIGTSMISTFFPVYYSTVLNGDLDFLSFVIGLAAIPEWLLMVVIGKWISKISPKIQFAIIALSGCLMSAIFCLVTNTYVVVVGYIFQALLFAFLWSSTTPYIAKIVPVKNLTVAQGTWTLCSSGIATAIGSVLGGIFSGYFGLRNLFLFLTCWLLGLTALCCVLFPKLKEETVQ